MYDIESLIEQIHSTEPFLSVEIAPSISGRRDENLLEDLNLLTLLFAQIRL